VSTEDEGFLNRWARRKQEAAKESSEEPAKIEELGAPPEQSAAVEKPAAEEFDISTLPPIDSITAGTDIRAFLSKGVPAALTQAALRRAWSADPAIRDYIGLSEYSWDFNTPGQFGFGELDPSINIQDMVADIFGKVKEVAQKTETLAGNNDLVAPQTEPATAQDEVMHSVELRSDEKIESAALPNNSPTESESGDKSAQASVALHQADLPVEESHLPARRHGSALPS
jgi:hypothetical protein